MTDLSIIAAAASTISAIGVVFTIASKTKSRRMKEVQETMTLWVVNGGGALIRKIVREENQAVIDRFKEHELTEPERLRATLRAIRAESEGE